MRKEDLKTDEFFRQLPERHDIWHILTSDTNEKIIALPILTTFGNFGEFKSTIARLNIGDFQRQFLQKYSYETNKIDEKTLLFITRHRTKKESMRSLLTILTEGLWIWLSFDKSQFKDIVVEKLVKYIPGIYFGSVEPKTLERFIEKHISEDSLSVLSQRSPFVISKRVRLPSYIEEKYGHEEEFKEYYADREISIYIKATKRWLKRKLIEAKEFANSEVVSIQFKVLSPNPGTEVTISADELGIVEDRSYFERRFSPVIIANPFDSILNDLYDTTEIFRANLPKIRKENGIVYFESFGKCFKYEVELEFENRSALEYDSYFIEKFFVGGVKEGWDYFSGQIFKREGNDFVAEVFEKKFGGRFLIKLEIIDDKLILYVLPEYWTTEQSLFLLYNVLQRKLSWNIHIDTCEKFPTDMIEEGENYGFSQIF